MTEEHVLKSVRETGGSTYRSLYELLLSNPEFATPFDFVLRAVTSHDLDPCGDRSFASISGGSLCLFDTPDEENDVFRFKVTRTIPDSVRRGGDFNRKPVLISPAEYTAAPGQEFVLLPDNNPRRDFRLGLTLDTYLELGSVTKDLVLSVPDVRELGGFVGEAPLYREENLFVLKQEPRARKRRLAHLSDAEVANLKLDDFSYVNPLLLRLCARDDTATDNATMQDAMQTLVRYFRKMQNRRITAPYMANGVSYTVNLPVRMQDGSFPSAPSAMIWTLDNLQTIRNGGMDSQANFLRMVDVGSESYSAPSLRESTTFSLAVPVDAAFRLGEASVPLLGDGSVTSNGGIILTPGAGGAIERFQAPDNEQWCEVPLALKVHQGSTIQALRHVGENVPSFRQNLAALVHGLGEVALPWWGYGSSTMQFFGGEVEPRSGRYRFKIDHEVPLDTILKAGVDPDGLVTLSAADYERSTGKEFVVLHSGDIRGGPIGAWHDTRSYVIDRDGYERIKSSLGDISLEGFCSEGGWVLDRQYSPDQIVKLRGGRSVLELGQDELARVTPDDIVYVSPDWREVAAGKNGASPDEYFGGVKLVMGLMKRGRSESCFPETDESRARYRANLERSNAERDRPLSAVDIHGMVAALPPVINEGMGMGYFLHVPGVGFNASPYKLQPLVLRRPDQEFRGGVYSGRTFHDKLFFVDVSVQGEVRALSSNSSD